MALNTKKRTSKRPIKVTVEKAHGHWVEMLRNIEKKQTRYIFSDEESNVTAAIISEIVYASLVELEESCRKIAEEYMLLEPKKLKKWLAIDNTPAQINFSIEQDSLQDVLDDVQTNHMRYMIMKDSGTLAAVIVNGQTYKAVLSHEKFMARLAEYHASRQL